MNISTYLNNNNIDIVYDNNKEYYNIMNREYNNNNIILDIDVVESLSNVVGDNNSDITTTIITIDNKFYTLLDVDMVRQYNDYIRVIFTVEEMRK